MTSRYLPILGLLVVGCGATAETRSAEADGGLLEMTDGAPVRDSSVSTDGEGGPAPGSDGGVPGDGGAFPGVDGGPPGGPISCSAPGKFAQNGGGCGSERWDIKTGTDNGAPGVSLVPKTTTIAQLVALPASGGGASRSAPIEKTL